MKIEQNSKEIAELKDTKKNIEEEKEKEQAAREETISGLKRNIESMS